MFQFKPDGEVTMRFMQDGNGMPAPLMQVRMLSFRQLGSQNLSGVPSGCALPGEVQATWLSGSRAACWG
jgi:hypothetical protein